MMLAVAEWITALMNFDPTKVLIGRESAMQETFTNDYIVVDNLFMKSTGMGIDFDGVNESESRSSYLFGAVTVEFYGGSSMINANRFMNTVTSQRSKDIAKSFGLAVYRPTRINNIPQQLEATFYPRAEVELNVRYNITNTEKILRVESPQITYIGGGIIWQA